MVFLKRIGQNQFFGDLQVKISDHKSTKVVNEFWFQRRSLSIFNKKKGTQNSQLGLATGAHVAEVPTNIDQS